MNPLSTAINSESSSAERAFDNHRGDTGTATETGQYRHYSIGHKPGHNQHTDARQSCPANTSGSKDFPHEQREMPSTSLQQRTVHSLATSPTALTELKETTSASLPGMNIWSGAKALKTEEITNLLCSVATLLDYGAKMKSTFKENVVNYLLYIKTRTKTFNPGQVTNLPQSLATINDYSPEPIPAFRETLEALLVYVKSRTETFSPREIGSLLYLLPNLLNNRMNIRQAQPYKETLVTLFYACAHHFRFRFRVDRNGKAISRQSLIQII